MVLITQISQFRLSVESGIFSMAKKQSSQTVSSIAGKVLAGKQPTAKETKQLAGSVLSQDEKKGKK